MGHVENYNKRLEAVQGLLLEQRRTAGLYAFHIGLEAPEDHLGDFLAWVSDGDSWDVWGEPAGQDEEWHVVLLTYHPGEMLDLLRTLPLVPMGAQEGVDQEGYLVCCTDPLDWSEQDYPRWQLRMEQSNG